MFRNILLEPEQEGLLVKLVEASRNTPDGKRKQFYYAEAFDPFILHSGLPSGKISVHIPDLKVLNRTQLISVNPRDSDSGTFDILPLGFRYYEYLKSKSGVPPLRLQSVPRNYLSSEQFQKYFPNAYRKWTEAETLAMVIGITEAAIHNRAPVQGSYAGVCR